MYSRWWYNLEFELAEECTVRYLFGGTGVHGGATEPGQPIMAMMCFIGHQRLPICLRQSIEHDMTQANPYSISLASCPRMRCG